MPFVHDQTEIDWPEDGSDPGPPRADQFVYLPAPEFTGVASPVRFSTEPPSAPMQSTEAQKPAEPISIVPEPSRGILGRLFGGPRPVASQQSPQISNEERREREQLRREQRRQSLFAVTIPALRSLGVKRAYCRYDGGNDEGFAWLDHYEDQDGNRLDLNVLAKQLFEMNVYVQLRDVGFDAHLSGISDDQKRFELKGFVSGWLCQHWASLLLGDTFGTGEYSMYGAFTADLDECTVTDDPKADPIVENIEIVI